MQRSFEIERIQGSARSSRPDFVVVEEPLEIRLNGEPVAVTMRTPGQDDALAAGFLVSEGILTGADQLLDVVRCADPDNPDSLNIVDVIARADAPAGASRQRYATSSCGICGRAAIDQIRTLFPPLPQDIRLSRTVVAALPPRLRVAQHTFERTGGLHAAGLFDLAGELLSVEEDVGRHNAVDKVVGRALVAGRFPPEHAILVVSGRAGFEIVQKALAARIPAVCSVSAPSSLAVELARACGMILAGFLRGDGMNLYAGGDRVD